MKKVIDMAFKKANDNSAPELFIKENDSETTVDVTNLLRSLYNPDEGEIVKVRLIANDNKETEMEFNFDYAKEIIYGTKNGRFETIKGRLVRLLAYDLAGEYPILGILDGKAMQWNEKGISQDGEMNNKIQLIIPIQKTNNI